MANNNLSTFGTKGWQRHTKYSLRWKLWKVELNATALQNIFLSVSYSKMELLCFQFQVWLVWHSERERERVRLGGREVTAETDTERERESKWKELKHQWWVFYCDKARRLKWPFLISGAVCSFSTFEVVTGSVNHNVEGF